MYGYLVQPAWVGVADKTFWDFLVLLVPVAISAQIALFTAQQTSEQHRAEEEKSHRQHMLESERAQESAVQTYADQLASLLAQSGSHTLQESDELRLLVTARTRMLLNQADTYRKKNVLLFLYDAGLIQGNPPIVGLRGADLSIINLSYVDLSSANLSSANLQGADLTGTTLEDVNLKGADLSDATVTQEQLDQAYSLKGAIMPNGQKYEDWLKSKGSGENGENRGPS
jgi:hypothetical protein